MDDPKKSQYSFVYFLKIAAAAVVGCFTGYMIPDNPVEQAAEEFIQKETGVSIDLSGYKKK